MTQVRSQSRKRLTDLENKLMVAGEGIVREFGKVLYTLLYSKWITNKDPLYGTWNSIYSMLCVSLVDGEVGGLGENGYMYMYG